MASHFRSELLTIAPETLCVLDTATSPNSPLTVLLYSSVAQKHSFPQNALAFSSAPSLPSGLILHVRKIFLSTMSRRTSPDIFVFPSLALTQFVMIKLVCLTCIYLF